MLMEQQNAMVPTQQVRRPPNSNGLYDVLDLILDKGIVVDAFVRVSLVGIELLTVDARVVIASVDTYLRYAERVGRLNLEESSRSTSLPDMVNGGMKSHALKQGAQRIGDALSGESDDEGDDEGQSRGLLPALTRGVRHIVKDGVGRIAERVTGGGDDDDDDEKGRADDSGRSAPERHRGNSARRPQASKPARPAARRTSRSKGR